MRHAAFVSLTAVLLGLAAAPAPGHARQGVVPQGSYAQSCSGAFVNQGRLYANCRGSRGSMLASSIELAACSNSDIGNNNGLLVCAGVQGRMESGGGSPPQSVTVYADANYSGASATFSGPMSNLASSGWNDQISSMQLQGRWTACSDANFGGTCQTFSGNVRNLSGSGLNDQISSLRPAG